MSDLRRHLSEIGRKGGIISRRTLDPDTARRMVAMREAKRVARRVAMTNASMRGVPADTSAAAQAVQDMLWRRATAAEKLMMVTQLSRAVETLALAGLSQRHPTEGDRELFLRRAEARLGAELAARIYR